MRWIGCLLGLLCCFTHGAWAAHQNQPIKLMLKWKHQFQFAGYYMALEKGFYHDVGLNVHIIEYDNSQDVTQSVVKHDGTYGITSSGALLSYAQGEPIQALAAILQHSPMALMVLKDSNIHRMEDLVGKRISLATGIEHIEIIAALAKHHIHSSDYIHENNKLGIKELMEHRTDAFPVYMSHESKVLRQQGVSFRLFYPKDDGIDFYGDVLITSKQETTQHPNRVKNFLTATQRGWRYALNHVDETIDVILKKYNSQHLSRQNLHLEAQTLKPFMMADIVPIGYMNPTRWQEIADTYVALGLLPNSHVFNGFIYHPEDMNHWLLEHRWQLLAVILCIFLCITFFMVWSLRQKGLQRIAQLEIVQRSNLEKYTMQWELEKKNQQLRQALKDAEQATQVKGQFLATMSHEIRTPLNGVLGLTELVLGTTLSDQQRDHLETIQSSGEALLSILNDILDFSKIDAGLMTMKTREFNPNHLIEHVVKLFSSKVENQGGVMLMTQCIPLLTHRLIGDVDHLHQVLVNLLSNAVKFTEHGDIILSVTQQAESEEHIMLRFRVKDTGIGISKQDKIRLFNAFTQADSSNQRKHGGTGLGLSIVKRLVDLMGSQIQLDSTLGQGSTFFFNINLKKSESTNTGGPIDYLPYFSQWRILLMDHHRTHRNMLQDVLQAWGIECHSYSVTEDAQNALGQAHDTHYDMVFASQEAMDADTQLLQAIQHSSAQFIMMIDNNIHMDTALREQYGLSGFMRKPIFIRSLCETVLSVMGVKERKTTVIDSSTTDQRDEYILLAEDNLVNQQVVLAMLERQGFEHIDVVGDGLAAVQQAKERQYDLILMDVQMPHMDGLSACREIRTLESMQHLPHTPILALTAHALEEDRQESLHAGMDEHLTKPLTGKRLQEAFATWLPHTPSKHVQKPEENSKVSDVQDDKPAPVDRQLLCQLQHDIGFGIGMILDTYIQSLPQHVEAMRQAIADDDADALRRCGHKLKGSSRSVAALHLGELAYHIELLGSNHTLESASHEVDELEDAIQHVISALGEDWVQTLR